MFKRLLSLALVFGMAALAPPVRAQNCAARELVTERLSTQFQEELQAGGLQNTRDVQTILEIWASPESGSYTVLITLPTGLSCVMASGQHFFVLPPTVEPPGAPS